MDVVDNENLYKQLRIFHLRVHIARQTSETSSEGNKTGEGEGHGLTQLASHLSALQQTTFPDKLTQELQIFSQALQGDKELAAAFLVHFFRYVLSTLDLEDDLEAMKEISNCLRPHIYIALKEQFEEQALCEILQSDLMQNLYKCAINTFKRESQYQEGSIADIMRYQSNKGKKVKAHVVRMNQSDSKKMFQETFGDSDDVASLYLIYIWQIYRIYEIKDEDATRPSIHDLTRLMEKSGKSVVIVPYTDMMKMSLTDPVSPAGRYNKILTQSDKIAARHPIPDLDFEWTDFRFSFVYPNGVVFLVNSAQWQEDVKKVSSVIQDLEVKRVLRYSPALGSTFALMLKSDADKQEKLKDVSFVRVRVVRVVEAVCWVFGVDTGSFHQCRARNLLLLPAVIRNLPPCGRLARLPVIPSPAVSSVTLALTLMTALVQHTHPTLNLTQEEVWQASLWLQVTQLTLPVLHLLKALTDVPSIGNLLPAVASVAADYLQRLVEQERPNQEAFTPLVSILTQAMHKSSSISLLLAKQGIFPALCEAALTWRCVDAWQCIKALLGTGQVIKEFLNHHTKSKHFAASRRNPKKWHQPHLSGVPDSLASSPTVMEMARTPTSNHGWDLRMHVPLISPQLAIYQPPDKWCDNREEKVLTSHTNVLQKGHYMGVKSHLTCHILQERNVSSICSDTLLQIILGMLNTHLGGEIYIGLNQQGVVQGVKMTRDQQDSFLLGFCKLVKSDIEPSVLPCDSVANIVPVVQNEAVSPKPDSGYYVVIITVRPESQQVYFAKEHPDKLYMRESNGVTLPLHGPRKTELLSKHHDWLQELECQVKEEKQAMLQLALSMNH